MPSAKNEPNVFATASLQNRHCYDVIDESHDIKHTHESVEFQNKYPRNLFVVFYLNH